MLGKQNNLAGSVPATSNTSFYIKVWNMRNSTPNLSRDDCNLMYHMSSTQSDCTCYCLPLYCLSKCIHINLISVLFSFHFYLCVCIYEWVIYTCVQLPSESRRGPDILLQMVVSSLMGVLEPELQTSWTSALNYWVIILLSVFPYF